MGLLDNLKKLTRQAESQFIEIIEWLEEGSDTLVYRFPVHRQEIKMGARLTVRENQVALLVNEGRAADLFSPGLHTLSTRNIPILTTLKGWKYGFESPFKAEVYFFNTRVFADLKWGTSQPVMMRDKEFGMIRLRAFGTYAVRVSDARKLFTTLVGTQGLTTTEAIAGQLRSIISSRFSDSVAEAGVAALDLASRYDELSEQARKLLGPDFSSFGLDLARFYVENLSLPEEVQAAIDQRTRLSVLSDRLPQYAQLQAAEAMTIAAAAPGGTAGAGVGLGAGLAMGQVLARETAPTSRQTNAAGAASGVAPGSPAGAALAPPPPGAAARAAPDASARAAPDASASAVARWSIHLAGRTFGPYTDQALREMIAAGQVEASTLVWMPGAAGWSAVAAYPEFSDLFPRR